ncbi:Ger(x)C family spore germination protein [Paenibacillus sp. NEAU-GSW1]|uniref:Ger(x)C family spore germination protein n=1 Tax=Paenibacillus sp. NEAU-GSW1 TaxID=2682486 RepID=UPI0012E2A1F4|nr:Ger(x)C family spore germination protein [Paenibacillus sp. NEAU-GSW1]MUT64501.1 Ger(x)C family spore germination protein [Paenibacillus sp. NEAU-GSW1]
MKFYKAAALVIGALVFLPLLSGCWSRVELNELAITSATSIDREEEEWINTYQVVIPSTLSSGLGTAGGGSGDSPVIVYSTRGRTVREATLKSYSESPRKLYFAHNRVIILSEETARRGINEILDVYFRMADARETVVMLVTPGKSRKVLEQMMQLQRIPGDGIKQLNNLESEYTSVLPQVKLYEMTMNLASDSGAGLMPEVFISGSPETTSMKAFQETSHPSKLKLGRLAVFKGDKMVGWLSRKEALGVAFLRDTLEKTTLTVACPDNDKKFMSMNINSSKTDVKAKKGENGLVYDIKIEAQASMVQTGCSGVKELYKPDNVRKMEQMAEQDIMKAVNAGWRATQKWNADVVNFAAYAHQTFPRQWRKWKKDWDAEFARITIKPQVRIHLTQMGLSNQPIDVEKLREGKK